ncbi:potassium channel family protein [Halalkalibacter akibai]|uniref:Potassium channel protein n=1 Tax=Halalkalibacter akibai (strain ATCC 43226 / DSM 21942 / CIP 109018 / JCM 9157 / 1139) TaxID=1236973 RepID=W4R0F3_HALA3|nr:potassium channel family protein [Halalkalibacter akibai]GAE37642.1 potassium channel protein [Halalkalibacter akibai JCM 9157]
MNWILSLILIIATIGTIVSILMLLRYRPIKGRHSVSLRHFTLLFLVYITVILSFSILYLGFELMGIQVIKEGNAHAGGTVPHLVEDIIYFSAITMLSVGYGDIVPVGFGRIVAIVQALFGYLLPAAFVVTSFIQVTSKPE